MNESRREKLIADFRDQEYRESYAEDFLNTSIATQLRVVREQREVTQTELAEAIGTKQTAISRIENVNNTARNIGTLMKVAFKLGCRLKVSFETFGSLIDESLEFSREQLQRPSFEEDTVFMQPQSVAISPAVAASDISMLSAGAAYALDVNASAGQGFGIVHGSMPAASGGLVAGNFNNYGSMTAVSGGTIAGNLNNYATVTPAIYSNAGGPIVLSDNVSVLPASLERRKAKEDPQLPQLRAA